jgi:hypothetical protein
MVLMRLHEMRACDAHDATVIVLEDVAQSRRLTFSADPAEARRLADAVTRGPRAWCWRTSTAAASGRAW